MRSKKYKYKKISNTSTFHFKAFLKMKEKTNKKTSQVLVVLILPQAHFERSVANLHGRTPVCHFVLTFKTPALIFITAPCILKSQIH